MRVGFPIPPASGLLSVQDCRSVIVSEVCRHVANMKRYITPGKQQHFLRKFNVVCNLGDVGRALGYPYAEVDRVAKLIPPLLLGKHAPLADSVKKMISSSVGNSGTISMGMPTIPI